MRVIDTCSFRRIGSRGFSLLELIAVMAVIAILAAITLGIMGGVRERSIRSRTEAELSSLRSALAVYKLHYGSYPVVDSGSPSQRSAALLDALSGKTDPLGNVRSGLQAWIQPEDYMLSDKGDYLVDGWSMPIFYAYSESSNWGHEQFFLISTGVDLEATFPGDNGNYDPGMELNLDNLEGLGE